MDRNEKKRKREYIGDHLDITGSRFKDEEVEYLADFVDNYDKEYRGKSTTETSTSEGWSSDGKYKRTTKTTETFPEDGIGIQRDVEYHDNDGDSGSFSELITNARAIYRLLKARK